MLEFFEKVKEAIHIAPKVFPEFVEEVCNAKAKEFCSTKFKRPYEGTKDRSNTFSSGYEFKSSIGGQRDEKLFIPRNNPLHDMKINK